jgi:hypothetical protein
MKMLLKRIIASMLGRKPGLPGGQIGFSQNGFNVQWKGKMSPYSDERAQWVEARLFCLANMARDTLAEGSRRANQFMTSNPHEAHLLMNETLKQINIERLMLMAERAVSDEYTRDHGKYGARR